MPAATTARFAALAHVLSDEARRRGLAAPTFSSPPRLDGVVRSMRRRVGAPPAVAVRVTGRPPPEVAADMIEGVVVANRLQGSDADACRAALWAVVEGVESRAA